ncbi:MAG: hypothetical protein ACFNZX_05440 [Actinomyces sp.]|nr:hypothetical protein [uncultured Actinomyces sp.]
MRQHTWAATMPKIYKSVPAALTMCPCEYGPCGYCSSGSHENCAYDKPRSAQWTASRTNVPAGWVTTADQQFPSLGGTDSWQIWEAGIQYDSRCPCARADHHGALIEPADPVKGRQATVFDILDHDIQKGPVWNTVRLAGDMPTR